ncbi:transcriptional regulator, AraC family [Dyadobacter koreensis]|uniref:Transcriptional regulator, AraC family n=1 Tax=Dyadobacter koreensis TaxID=408657 RepID=A0A1H6XQ17_9BACT|nr:AraC family transcriptional regulator [Dyadobacter koreensis]SEJ31149.1 transcriptional regulator, AraC family [Dyadobacter koreensis]
MNNISNYDRKAFRLGSPGKNLPHSEDTERKLFFYASVIENETERSNLNVLQRLNNYQIVWLTNGSATCVVDMEEHCLESQSMYIVAPGQIHFLHPKGEVEGYIVSFSEEFLLMMSGSLNLPFDVQQQVGDGQLPVISIDVDMKSEMEDLIKRMMKEISGQFQLRSEILMALLRILIIYFSRQVVIRQHEKAQHHDMVLVKRFKYLLEQHFFTKKTVADYASELAVSPNYLSGKIKTISGFSASHHIQQRIVLEAKRKVMFSGGSLKEVAYYLGFDDTSHFSKFFKNKSGVNFSDFKKAIC